MNKDSFIKFVNEKGYVSIDDEAFNFMNKSAYRAQKITNKINNKFNSQNKIQLLISVLTKEKINRTLKLFPPIYTDFGMNLHIGNNVFINSGCCFQDQGGIYIGDNVLIGHQVVFATINHDKDFNKRGSMEFKPIHIGNNVWIGAHVTILPGVCIGNGVIIGAGAVVSKDIPDYAIVVGVPGRILNYIQ